MLFTEIRAHVPLIASWMEACYTLQPSLRLGYHHLRSCCGVQQEDPLGLHGFVLTLHPIVEEIEQRVPGLKMNTWYLDNGTLFRSPADLTAGLAIIAKMGPSRGLLLNYSKCVIFLPAGADPNLSSLPANIFVVHSGLNLLGCPIGPPAFCVDSIMKRITKLRDTLARLPDLKDFQIATPSYEIVWHCLRSPFLSEPAHLTSLGML